MQVLVLVSRRHKNKNPVKFNVFKALYLPFLFKTSTKNDFIHLSNDGSSLKFLKSNY